METQFLEEFGMFSWGIQTHLPWETMFPWNKFFGQPCIVFHFHLLMEENEKLKRKKKKKKTYKVAILTIAPQWFFLEWWGKKDS
jgi:hypothetical protein